jgi:hypothetical protein
MKKQFILLVLGVSVLTCASAQQFTQTVRGSVIDKISQRPIPGAIVTIENSNPLNGTTTDINGKFALRNVSVGRQSIKVTYIGYKDYILPNIVVNSGKEVVLTIQLEESIVVKREVVVRATQQKNKPINELALVSARTFSIEETQKFAAAVNDPARMATSFAGVVQVEDGNNGISIRGNSPNGMIWRLEGVDIPNPNHFSNVGTSGGGISILSVQLLSNSDFITGAFSSDYGNALSGVFDLKLRKGNNEKREFTLQAGFLGLDFAAEGPLKKDYEGSYLINYRYSTLSILNKLGINVGEGVTNFQDLSFNLFFPSKQYGSFGFFGFGGLSNQNSEAVKDSTVWLDEIYKQYTSVYVANTGAAVLNHTLQIRKRSFIKTSLVASGNLNKDVADKLNKNYELRRNTYSEAGQSKVALNSIFSTKINAHSSFKLGLIYSLLHYDLIKKKTLIDSVNTLKTWINTNGRTATLQFFGNWSYKIYQRWTTNVGLHYLQLMLNNSQSLEPRVSVKYDASSKSAFAAGYGLQSQIQPLGAYFTTDALTNQPINKNLLLSKAHHLVLSYDYSISVHTHIKTEGYYQDLFHIPISRDSGSTMSLLNVRDGFTTEKLTSDGKGRNYGVEITVERFLHKYFYYLLSISLFDSKYRAADGNWYNTRFNTNFASSFTGGKEWKLSEKHKNKVIGLNIKVIYTGGTRTTPVDLPGSIASGNEVNQTWNAFTKQNPSYFRLDTKISIKRNFAHSTSSLALDIQNTTNHKNVGGQYFDVNSGKIKFWYQSPLIPVLSYRLEF